MKIVEIIKPFVEEVYDIKMEQDVKLNFKSGEIIEILNIEKSGFWMNIRYKGQDYSIGVNSFDEDYCNFYESKDEYKQCKHEELEMKLNRIK